MNTEEKIEIICTLTDGIYPAYTDKFVPNGWWDELKIKVFGEPEQRIYGYITIKTEANGNVQLMYTNGIESHNRWDGSKAWTLTLDPKQKRIFCNCEQAISMWMHYHCYTTSGYNTIDRYGNALKRLDEAYRALQPNHGC